MPSYTGSWLPPRKFGRGWENYPDKPRIAHLWARTTLSLIKELQWDDLDDDLSWQYGMVYDTPWKDCDRLVTEYRNKYPLVLYQYVLKKVLDELKKISAYIAEVYQLQVTDLERKKKLTTPDKSFYFKPNEGYHRVPITGAVVNQLDVIISTGKLVKATSKPKGKYINDRYLGSLKQICSQVTDLEGMLVINFLNISDDRQRTNEDHSYLRQDQLNELLSIANQLIYNEYNTPYNIAARDIHFDTIRTIAYTLSILIHTFFDQRTKPDREEDTYRDTVEHRTFNDIIPMIREYTDRSLAYVIGMPFSVPNRPWNKNAPERRNIVNPYSLQERYLALRYFLETSASCF